MTATEINTRILIEARRLLARPYGWIKGDASRLITRRGQAMYAFCALGAMNAASRKLIGSNLGVEDARAIFADANSIERVSNFNDAKTTRKADVLKAFDRAIEKSKLRG
jgi:hypothetical protein